MERLTEKQHLKLNKQEAYKLYMDTLHELALATNELLDSNDYHSPIIDKYETTPRTPPHMKDNLYAF